MDFLKAAERYVRLGFKVFPLKRDSKVPLTEHGVLDATDDMDALARYVRHHPNANIAVGCGPDSGAAGITAIDVDRHKGGVETMQALLRKHPALPRCPMSRTPQGGHHMLFRHEAGIGNSVEVLGKGLDVKTKGGYIVLPPSQWDGMKKGKQVAKCGGYKWLRPPLGSHLPPLPDWMLKLLLPKPMPKFAPKQWDKSNTSLVQVAKALKFVPNHDYDTWYRTGMAIKSGFGDEGFELWCNWSGTGYADYSPKECQHKWASFKRSNGVGIGSVFHAARMGGADLKKIFGHVSQGGAE